MSHLPQATNIMETKSGLIPTSINEAMQLSEILAKSEIVPKAFLGKASNIFVAINWGIEIGLSPMQSLQNIAVINGNPALWGDAPIALVRGSGLLASIKETQTEEGATCVIQRIGEEPHTYTFTRKDAQTAGLLGRDTYKKYPKRMFQMRARSFALRDVFPDVLKGIKIAEEEQDNIEEETNLLSKENPTNNTQTKDPLAEVAQEPIEAEIVKEEPKEEPKQEEVKEVVTIQTMNELYKTATPQLKAKIGTVLTANPEWRTYEQDKLTALYNEIMAL